MSEERQKKIDKFRQSQPIEELQRKYNKAKGRHSNAFWMAEELDIAFKRAEEMYKFFKGD